MSTQAPERQRLHFFWDFVNGSSGFDCDPQAREVRAYALKVWEEMDAIR